MLSLDASLRYLQYRWIRAAKSFGATGPAEPEHPQPDRLSRADLQMILLAPSVSESSEVSP